MMYDKGKKENMGPLRIYENATYTVMQALLSSCLTYLMQAQRWKPLTNCGQYKN